MRSKCKDQSETNDPGVKRRRGEAVHKKKENKLWQLKMGGRGIESGFWGDRQLFFSVPYLRCWALIGFMSMYNIYLLWIRSQATKLRLRSVQRVCSCKLKDLLFFFNSQVLMNVAIAIVTICYDKIWVHSEIAWRQSGHMSGKTIRCEQSLILGILY